ncbi:MAG: efflux transporter outer membrane subunit [Planctomycetes bacterium]|nr:efflux transporter outer membrane subunit [Planctomycetota bacterium]
MGELRRRAARRAGRGRARGERRPRPRRRVEQAAAQARAADAALAPSAGATFGGQRQRQNFVGLPLPGGGDVLSTTSTSYGLSLDVAWELDLWGALDAEARAAEAGLHAGEAELRGARLSLAGQATKAWLALAATRLQLAVAERRVASFEQTSRLMRARYADGLVDPLDLRLTETQLESARAAAAAQRAAQEGLVRQLEALLGAYPAGALEGPADLPALPDAVPVGLPSELLVRRPDLAAAVERLRAADLRLYEARKALWPSLRLTASGGRRSADLEDLTRSAFDVWSLAGSLTQPLFEGGRLRAGVDLAEARVREGLASYQQATLRAFSEVESALAASEHLDARVASLAQAAEHALAGEALAEARYRAGRYDVLAVLTARRQAFEAESALIEARRARLEARVDLHLALGGGFEQTDEDETLDTTPR